MDDQEMAACLEVACRAAERGGAMLEGWRRHFAVRQKGRFDLVTDADLAAQDAIQSVLREHFPHHAFLGEEGGPADAAEDGRPTWVVDPLDGTTNYVHGYPFYAVSIGLEVTGEPVLGVVLDPVRDELFRAARGQGAWLNDVRLATSPAAGLEEALLCVGFPPDLRGQEHALEAWRHFSLNARSLRRTGSTALNLAYLAAGRCDGFWSYQIHPWDVAAGLVLVREAGGTVTRPDGGPYRLGVRDLLASNGPLHPTLVEHFAEFLPPGEGGSDCKV
jgi:myo-inositol-1(or 4)-monophosphatase